jgi:hypothetical protein
VSSPCDSPTVVIVNIYSYFVKKYEYSNVLLIRIWLEAFAATKCNKIFSGDQFWRGWSPEKILLYYKTTLHIPKSNVKLVNKWKHFSQSPCYRFTLQKTVTLTKLHSTWEKLHRFLKYITTQLMLSGASVCPTSEVKMVAIMILMLLSSKCDGWDGL